MGDGLLAYLIIVMGASINFDVLTKIIPLLTYQDFILRVSSFCTGDGLNCSHPYFRYRKHVIIPKRQTSSRDDIGKQRRS